MTDLTTSQFLLALLEIIWIDILLSGDNAVVIALACRSLPENQRRLGVLLGAGTAVALRIVFAVAISYLLALPFLKVAGALLLVWIALKLVASDEGESHEVEAAGSLWSAVRTIAVADAVMSFDNVVAIVGASQGHNWLFVFGLLLSIPLIIFGATMIMSLIERFPAFIWAGAALLGWIAGEMLVADPAALRFLAAHLPAAVTSVQNDLAGIGLKAAPGLHYGAAVAGGALVLLLGFARARLARRRLAAG